MPDAAVLVVLAVLLGAMALFIAGRLRVDVVALSVLAVLALAGLIRPDQVMSGFANKATATVAAMFVLSSGLVRTGWVAWLVRHLGPLAGRSPNRLLLVLCVTIAALSAFVINTATVAIFIPVAIALAKERRVAPSRVLMPLSFASQFGGVCTLIGTSTNLLVSSLAVGYGLEGFGMFEFAPLGLVLCAAGVGYLLLASPRLIPKREGEPGPLDAYRLADYLIELAVADGSPLTGRRWGEDGSSELAAVRLLQVIRAGKATSRAARTKLRAGDTLLLHGNAETILDSQHRLGLQLAGEARVNEKTLQSHEIVLVEALVPPDSSLVGRTSRVANLRRRFGCTVLAIQRRGKVLRDRLDDVRLDDGDSLLLQGTSDDVAGLLKSDALIVTNELTDLYLRRDKATLALGILVLVVGLAALDVLPILVAALGGSLGMVLTGCLTIDEAYRAIDWKVIFLLGGIIPLGTALYQTGAADWVAHAVLGPFVGFGPTVVLAVLYLLTATLTETMSNNAAAVLLAPIAVSLATSLGADPRPFLVAITFAASTSFATPIGYKTNTMIYAPGGYRFLDYTRVGAPLNLVFWVLAVFLIPRLWPF